MAKDNIYDFIIAELILREMNGGVLPINPITVTYNELITLINGNSLQPGMYYEVIDYQSVNFLHGFDVAQEAIIGAFSTSFNITGLELHTGSVEPLVLKALDVNQLAPYGFSKVHQKDIIYYDPSKTGIPLQYFLYNGNPGQNLLNFDIDVSGATNVYINLPPGVTATQGTVRIAASFSDSTFMDAEWFNIEEGTTTPANDYGTKFSNIQIVNNGSRIVLSDFTSTEQALYLLDTLYVEIESYYGNAPGIITRRIDTAKNNDLACDWRAIRYIRYNADLSPVLASVGAGYWATRDTLFGEPADENDNLLLPIIVTDSNYNVVQTTHYNPRYDNNVFNAHDFKFGKVKNNNVENAENSILLNEVSDNVIKLLASSTLGNYAVANIFKTCEENQIGDYCMNNVMGPNFQNNTIASNFTNNLSIESCQYNKIQSGFQFNQLGRIFINNEVDSANCQYNQFSSFSFCTLTGEMRDCTIAAQTCGFHGDFELVAIADNLINTELHGEFLDIKLDIIKSSKLHGKFKRIIISDAENLKLTGEFATVSLNRNVKNITISGVVSNLSVGRDFINNDIAGQVENVVIGGKFQTNKMQGELLNSTLGNNFVMNNLHGSVNTCILPSNFRLNKLQGVYTAIDFTSATHVLGNYNCELHQASDMNQYLSYYNGSTIIYTNITD